MSVWDQARHMRAREEPPARWNALCERSQPQRNYPSTIALTSDPADVRCDQCLELMADTIAVAHLAEAITEITGHDDNAAVADQAARLYATSARAAYVALCYSIQSVSRESLLRVVRDVIGTKATP